MWWRALLGVVAGVLLLYAVLLGLLWRALPRDRADLRATLRLLPDVLRLLRRLAADRTLPRGVRTRLALGLAYLAMPIDVVPDVIPVLGWADDAVVVALVLRSVARRAGPDALTRHWPGTPDGLRALLTLAGLDGR
jgi:uncharacterized membrane protein YkvA (DUF1232 family)